MKREEKRYSYIEEDKEELLSHTMRKAAEDRTTPRRDWEEEDKHTQKTGKYRCASGITR
jgi:hypothetical protein